MTRVIGIDLGTTNSVVAVMNGGEAEVITNEEGSRLTPSVVAYSDKGEMLVGQVAKRQAVVNPKKTVYSVKRFMGRSYDEVAPVAKRMSYEVVADQNNRATISLGGKTLTPPEISAKILGKLKKSAEEFLGEKVTDAVITVPAYFNDAQRQATKDAGRIAGLNVRRIINEPTAAALAYGLDKKKNEVIAVFDFGGGTFDISVLEVGDNVVEVLATNGNTQLGGDNLDERLVDVMVAEFKKEHGIDLSRDAMAMQRLREAAEKAKVELSSTLETDINLPFLTADQSGPRHFQMRLTRARFESLVQDLLDQSLEPTRRALADAKKSAREIDEVVLVGGSTRIPKLQQMVEDFFGKKPHKGVNPDEVVAVGAAIQAGVLTGEVDQVLLLDVTPLSLGVETLGGAMTRLISRNTTIPTRKSEVFSTAEDGQSVVTVHVLQGEREMAADNRSLGRFNLEGIAPAPRGVPQIEVTFDIDSNGILNVSAKDMNTGRQQAITVTASSGLSEQEVQRLVQEAKKNEATDRRRREEVEQRNKADALNYGADKLLREHGDRLSAHERAALEEALSEAKEAAKGSDPTTIRSTQERLQGLVHRISESLYRTQQTQQRQSQPSGSQYGPQGSGGNNRPGRSTGGDDVIEAEFE